MTGTGARSSGCVVVFGIVHRVKIGEIEKIECVAGQRQSHSLFIGELTADPEIDVRHAGAGKRISRAGDGEFLGDGIHAGAWV